MRELFVAWCLAASALAGCSAGEQNDASQETSSAERDLQIWAGDLCAASDELQASVAGIADSIDVDISAGFDQLPQVYAQLQTRFTAVEAQVAEVNTVLSQAPGSSPEAVEFAVEVQTLMVGAQASGNEAASAVEQAANAKDLLGAGLAAAGAAAAAQKAYSDASAALALVDGARNGSEEQLSEAFATAPACNLPN